MNQPTSPDMALDSPEEAETYDKWFREQVELALANPGPMLPHEQAVEEIRALIEERGTRRTFKQC